MNADKNSLDQPIGWEVPGWKPASRPERAVINGTSCRLEPLSAGKHARQLFEANRRDADGRIWTYLPYGPFDTFESYHAWVSKMAESADPLFFAIIDSATETALGVGSYLRIDPANGTIEVGHLNFSPLLQRQRAATEAMYLMMKQAFALGNRRYEWKCNALNEPSRRAAQRLGFSFDGVFRQAAVVKGRNRDTAWYSITDRDWKSLEPAYRRWLSAENFDEKGNQKVGLSKLTAPLLSAVG